MRAAWNTRFIWKSTLIGACVALGLGTARAQSHIVKSGETFTNSAWHEERFSTIAAGSFHTIGRRTDGTIAAWGDNEGMGYPSSTEGQCSNVPLLPPGLVYVDVSAGNTFSVALRSDGVALPFGGGVGSPQLGPCLAISAGTRHYLALLADGSVTVTNLESGSLPPAPPLPPGLTYVAIAAGGAHDLARRSDGSVVAWGLNNNYGQCDVPALPAGLAYVQIEAGKNHSVARRSDGSVVAWGDNGRGQCFVPARPPGVSYVDIEAGGDHTLARRSDGSFVAWGEGYSGAAPALPPGVSYVQLAAGEAHCAARRSDGLVVTWGDNTHDQLNEPLPLPPGLAYSQITGNQIVLLSDGSIRVSRTDALRNVPPLPAGLSYVEVASNGGWAMARRSDGSVVAWGDDGSGQLHVPSLPSGMTYVEIAASEHHGLARRSDGNVIAWGSNDRGQCVVPALSPHVTYTCVRAAGDLSAACRSDGTAAVWGNSMYAWNAVPPLTPGMSYLDVAIGRYHAALVRSDGVAVGCTLNPGAACGAPALPPGLTYVDVHASDWDYIPPTCSVSIARRSDGAVISWGVGARSIYDQRLPIVSGYTYEEVATSICGAYARLERTTAATAPDLVRVTPSTIEALIPGTAHTITLEGTGLHLVTDLLLDGVPIDPTRYTIVSAAMISLDMPQSDSLGVHELGVISGTTTDVVPITLVAPSRPLHQVGSGDTFAMIERRAGLSYLLAGPVGSLQRLYVSPLALPSVNAYVRFDIGDQFTAIALVGGFVIPATGWLQVDVPAERLPRPSLDGLKLYSQSVALDLAPPFPVSNLQSIALVETARHGPPR